MNTNTAVLQSSTASVRKVVFSLIVLVILIALAAVVIDQQRGNPAESYLSAVNLILHVGIPQDAENGWLLLLFSIAGGVIIIYLVLMLVQAVYTNAMKKSIDEARRMKKVKEFSGHYIICGGGSLGFSVGKTLAKNGQPVVVLDKDDERVAEMNAADIPAVEGDCFNNDFLKKAGLMKAKIVIACLNDDGDNLLLTMLVKELNPNVKVIAEATYEKYAIQLKRAGADEVVLPREIGGRYIAKLAMGGSSTGVHAP